ncbi:MAG TPA: hypothetical protein VGG27_18835 [Magnetospirillaceae bacterium]|jgi:hypothetical protein
MNARIGMISGAVFLGIAAIEALAPSAAVAADKIDDADIVGFKLSMTQDQIRQYIATHMRRSLPFDIDIDFGQSGYDQKNKLGVAFEITDAPSAETPKPPYDYVAIAYNPNGDQHDIFSIMRTVHYDPSMNMTLNSIVSSLREKYGQEDSSLQGVNNFFWGADTGPRGECHRSAVAYEDGLLRRQYAAPQNLFLTFMGSMKGGPTKPQWASKPSHCGTVLFAQIISVNGYVNDFTIKLINIGRMESELIRFYADYAAHADKAASDKMNTDSKTKPKL